MDQYGCRRRNVSIRHNVPPREGHVAGKTFEGFDISICQHTSANAFDSLHYGHCSQGLRVKICLSKCSSRVKDCPQYVQKTILLYYRMLDGKDAMQETNDGYGELGNSQLETAMEEEEKQ